MTLVSRRDHEHKGKDPNTDIKTSGCSSVIIQIKKHKGLLDCEVSEVKNEDQCKAVKNRSTNPVRAAGDPESKKQ